MFHEIGRVFSPSSHAQFVRDKYASELERDVADQISSASAGLVDRVSSVGSELDWMEPSAYLCNSKMLQPHASERVYDAFHLLQTESSVQVPISVDPYITRKKLYEIRVIYLFIFCSLHSINKFYNLDH